MAPDESAEARDILGTPSAIEAYEELIGASDDRLNTRLLGHPDPLQGDMQDTCQLAGHGLWDGSSDPRVAELRRGSGEWRLLAQIDSHEDLGMMWGDCGRLYFWIRDADLRTRNWDAVWAIMQCH
ncbi:DUF1963 domain-containing protein [Gordonia phthalatica]|uniref:DUF1963 domain-containing protein n=1 Tax=Gordonia phthalatica TaxID=1136941 RepID=UPI000782FC6B|nr:YwqG family protein [Gordonia phthalatica]